MRWAPTYCILNHHNIIDAIPCVCVSARNFIIKTEQFYFKVIWQWLLFAGYWDNEIQKIAVVARIIF